MRKLLSLAAGLIMLVSISLRGSAVNPAEPHAPSQDGTMPALTAIAGQGMMSAEAYDDLEELSDYIGGRVTGSPQAGQAVQWGMQKMRAMGLENVRAEKWQISRGWTRGSASAEIVAPIHRRLTIDSMGWVGSTREGGEEAEIAPVNINLLEDEMKNNSGSWSGKVLLIVKKGAAPPPGMGNFARFGDFLKKAREA